MGSPLTYFVNSHRLIECCSPNDNTSKVKKIAAGNYLIAFSLNTQES